DWESGSLDAAGRTYITAWIVALVADGRFMPGLYCSYQLAPTMVNLLDQINPTPITRFWCWRVPTTDAHPYEGDLTNVPTPDPSGCGVAHADAWQRDQNAIVTLPDGAPLASLQVDFSTSSSPDPAAPPGMG